MMLGEYQVDWITWRRLDNATLIDFLTSTASVLAGNGFLSSKEIDSLRITFSSIQSTPAVRERPIIEQLIKERADILNLLIGRYGSLSLSLNIFRHSLMNLLDEPISTLKHCTEELLKRVELHFNRPFDLFFDHRCERRILFSAILMDLAEAMYESTHSIKHVKMTVSEMYPHGMLGNEEKDIILDEQIAKTLGFRGIAADAVPLFVELKAKRQLNKIFQDVVDYMGVFLHQYKKNLVDEQIADVLMLCDLLSAQNQKFSALLFPNSAELYLWEIKRQDILGTFTELNLLLKSLCQGLIDSLGRLENLQIAGKDAHALSTGLKRRLLFEMSASGLSANEVQAALDLLDVYLAEKKVAVKDLLPGELTKISPHLTLKVFERMQRLVTQEEFPKLSMDGKRNTLNRSEKLKSLLKNFSTLSLLLFFLGWMGLATSVLFSCGLKTLPKSDVIDPRPGIPFRMNEKPADNIDNIGFYIRQSSIVNK